MGGRELARVRPLPGRYLYWCCRDLGLAILRRGSKADNRDKNPGTWLVAGDQADDRELGRAARLGAAANGREHSESARRPFSLPTCGNYSR